MSRRDVGISTVFPPGSLWESINSFYSRGGFVSHYPNAPAGRVWYVDTINGGDSNSGRADLDAFATMTRAFSFVDSYDTIVLMGVVKEQLTGPVGVFDIYIVGAGYSNRQATDSGVATGGGACWLPPDSPVAATSLLTLIQQAWRIENVLFSPVDNSACVTIQRAAAVGSVAEKDGSHAKIVNCKFVGGTTAIGIELKDGGYNVLVQGNEFESMTNAIKSNGTGVSVPLECKIIANRFNNNTNSIVISSSEGTIYRNIIRQTANDANGKVNLISVAGQGSNNMVLENFFSDAVANVTIAKGYKPGTGDVWRNWVTDQADQVFVVPA